MRPYSESKNSSLQTSRKCRVSAKVWASIILTSLTSLPSDSPFLPRPVGFAVPAAAWPKCPCSASCPFPPKPLWMSRVWGLLQFFCGDDGGLSFTWPPPPLPPPPWRSFSFFCRRSYVLLALSFWGTNWGRPCGEWDSAETEGAQGVSLNETVQPQLQVCEQNNKRFLKGWKRLLQ